MKIIHHNISPKYAKGLGFLGGLGLLEGFGRLVGLGLVFFTAAIMK